MPDPRLLTAADLAARPTRDVDVPALAGAVRVRALTAAQVWRWQDAQADDARRAAGEPLAILVVEGAVNPDGTAMFAPDALPAVLALPFDVVRTIAMGVLAVSGLAPEQQEARAGN